MKKLAVLGLVLMMFCSVAYAGAIDGSSSYAGENGSHSVSFSGASAQVDYSGLNASVHTEMFKGNSKKAKNIFESQGDIIQGSFKGSFINGISKGLEFVNNSMVCDTEYNDGKQAFIRNDLITKKGSIINFMNVDGGDGAISTGNEIKSNEQSSYYSCISNKLDNSGKEVTEDLGQGTLYAEGNNFKATACNYSFGKVIVSKNNSYSKVTVEGSGMAEYSYGNAFLNSRKNKQTMAFIRTDAGSNNFTGYAELTAEGKGKSVWINGEYKSNSDGSELIYGQKEYVVDGVDIGFKSYLIDTRK
ncbi:hypothetical protein IMX26_10860 [Clostridium sp. 'deep sea']|uniref:hypothetical protein n=1 Tax=Clostridium sp. 'deep sea' TaxID=2779445 RepID=UPI00189648E6|nr:hypothetical protein [Clostridium sp. 'deep sea']QOR33992.1 hypothetical protein IMX26_10860 [Clostridium sp. 'deep sea']